MPRLLALASAAALLASCGRLGEVEITRTATGTLLGAPGSPPLQGGTFGALGLMLDAGALKQNGIDPGAVDSVKLVGLRLAVTRGTPFEAWLDAVSFRLEAPGLPGVLVARQSGIGALPSGTSTIELATSSDVDLKPYVLAPSSTVSAEVTGTQPPVATTVEATATLRVNVNLTGLIP